MPERSLVTRWSQAVVRKAASLMFPREQFRFDSLYFGPGRSTYNYAADVQDGLASSVVMPCVQWLMRSFPEAPLVVRQQTRDELEVVVDHPMVQLVNRPNAFYHGTILWMATITDWTWFGESYWRILRARGGQPAELWWIPPWSIAPKWPDDGSVYISHYDYTPSIGGAIRLEVEDIIHFRHGLDPRNMRHGLPPLRAILQDIWIDAESSNFVGAILRNMGVPGLILAPKGDERLSEEDVERVKAYIHSRFTGDLRGMPLALGGPTDVHTIAQTPADLDMSNIRSTAEERVSAALGIPAAVIGFGTGLSNSKVGATMAEFVRLAWSNGIVPMQRLMAAELQRTLLPLFENNADAFIVGWDYDEVSSLQEDQNALAKRYEGLWEKGLLKKSECRQALGYESDPEDDIYFHPNSGTAVDPKDQMPEPDPLPLPGALPVPAQGAQGNGNGNGAANGNGVVQQRAYGLKQGTTEEFINSLIGRQVQRMERPPASAVRMANRVWRDDQKAQRQLQQMVLQALQRYGSIARVASKEVLFPQKQDLTHILSSSVILERLPMVSVKAELGRIYEEMYQIMLGLTLEAIKESLDLEVTNPTAIEGQLRMLARERVGLLDLEGEARTAIIRTLEEGQLAGLDEDAMLKLLEERIPAGRWGSVETRARIISRSESRLASNISTSHAARDLGASLLVFDSRLGSFDAPCDERVGWIVTPAQAQALSAVEHTSGTLSFGIINQSLTTSQSGAAAT